ncbi:MAG: chemotaxis protein CheA, partial [Gemmatimonadota bacterium]|nr:chemotaxis protein CheA [Gemmatimonadota bacterium]
MDLSRYADLFASESREHVAELNRLLLELERSPKSTEVIDGIFRAAHSLKGMSAAMGHDAVASLAHELESVLDRVRSGQLAVGPAVTDALFAAADALESAIARASRGESGDDAHGAVIAQLAALLGRPTGPAINAPTPTVAPSGSGEGRLVRIRVASESPMRGVRAWMIVKRAESLGRVSSVTPEIEALQRGEFGRGFTLRLVTDAPRDEIERAILDTGDVEAVSVDDAVDVARETVTDARGEQRHIRVDTRRLDAMMNLVGELVIARGRLQRIADSLALVQLDDALLAASRLIAELQEEIIGSRMVPVSQAFDRFPRLVRDVAKQLGKEADLEITGGDIELDRSVLDVIGDPLTHLLRNAVDHGLESPDERAAAGKPRTGRIRIVALREHASVELRVSDDGRGIDHERVMAKARALGMLGPHERASDDDIARIIMRPGFSTAERVTELSGRGVGIDAVATTVRRLGGTLHITSERGGGTTIAVRLPATLAIVRALIARVGDETYAVPTTHVTGALQLDPAALRHQGGRELLSTREGDLPVLRLRKLIEMARGDDTLKQVIV